MQDRTVQDRAQRISLACAIGFALLVAGCTLWVVLRAHEAALRDAGQGLEKTALVLADQADRAFEAVELLQSSLVDQLARDRVTTPQLFRLALSGQAVHDDLRNRKAMLPQLDAVTAIDAEGTLINFSRYWPIPAVNVADRDYFKVLKNDPARDWFIGAPVPNRGTGTWTMYVARRVSAPDGAFLGLILGAVELSYFERLYGQVAQSDGEMIALLRHDGTLLARHPHSEPIIGRSFDQSDLFQALHRSTARHLLMRQISASDGTDRLYAAHRLGTHSMVLLATVQTDTALEDWRRQSATFAFGAAAIELVIAAMWLSLRHQFRNQKLLRHALAARIDAESARARAVAEVKLARERERAGLALKQQHVWFGAALENMSQALCLFDRTHHLVVANRRLAELFALPDGATAPGTALSTLVDRARGASNLGRSDLTLLARMTPRLADQRRTAAMIWELSDGRALSVHMRPIEDQGWLATIEDITERRQAEARIAHMAHHDALTGLANRVLFRKRLGQAIARARRGDPCAVLCLDLDQFKAVNDTLGHPIGDALLRAVTHRLQCEVRDTDILARLSGDEFAIVQSGVDQPHDATSLATRLIEVIAEPFFIDGNEIVIGTSIGIAIVPDDGTDPHELLKNADLALYRAKAGGRGTHRCFAPEMDAAMRARRALEIDLRRALTQNEFEVFYQPVLRMDTRTLIGFEALVRWRHPERGLLLPAEFVPFAEEVGLIVKIGEWVLHRACADAVTWPDHLKVAVNLCPLQFSNKRLVDDVVQALAQSGLPARRLELEITETVMIEDTEGSLATLHRLRGLGVAIAMDDFGTGYSSLSYLLQFPFDRVKIDRCFVAGLGQLGNSDAIVTAVTELCATLGMATTAEGVETEGQLDILSRSACTEVQGFLFGKAIEAEALPELWRRLEHEAHAPDLQTV